MLLNAATVVSLVLCAAAALLWARSRSRLEGFGWRTAAGPVWQIFSDRGRLCVDVVGDGREFPRVDGRLRENRVTRLRVWQYSVLRPPRPIWGPLDAAAATGGMPYRRWGLAVQHGLPPATAAGWGPYRLIPAIGIHWRWEDDYYKWPVSRGTGIVRRRDVDTWGLRVLGGDRYNPAWTDDHTALGRGGVIAAQTVAVSWWLPTALLALMPGLRTIKAMQRRVWAGRHPGRCASCGYDLRATPDRCPECGTTPARRDACPASS
jgi:hypothetical protein